MRGKGRFGKASQLLQITRRQVTLEIRRIQPGALILIMSGFSPQHVLNRFNGKGLNGFIQKPFHARDLLDALRKILESS